MSASLPSNFKPNDYRDGLANLGRKGVGGLGIGGWREESISLYSNVQTDVSKVKDFLTVPLVVASTGSTLANVCTVRLESEISST